VRKSTRAHKVSDEDEEDGEYVAQEIHSGEEAPEQKQEEEDATPKIRRSKRRRATQNKYVIYDTLDDEDYFHEIEKQAKLGKLDFATTILVHTLDLFVSCMSIILCLLPAKATCKVAGVRLVGLVYNNIKDSTRCCGVGADGTHAIASSNATFSLCLSLGAPIRRPQRDHGRL
jgi:hypothetical protein